MDICVKYKLFYIFELCYTLNFAWWFQINFVIIKDCSLFYKAI